MPVHTRRTGPPDGGYQELPEAKRKRKPPMPVRSEDQSTNTSTSANITPAPKPQFIIDTPCPLPVGADLTIIKAARATPSRKRPLDESSEDEHTAKRVQSETRINFFDPNRERSRLLQHRSPQRLAYQRKTQSARKPAVRRLSFDDSVAQLESLGPKHVQNDIPSRQEPSPAETPSKQSYVGSVFGSVGRGMKRIFFGANAETKSSPPANEPNPFVDISLPKQPSRFNSRLNRQNSRTAGKPRTSHVQPSVEETTDDQDFETSQIPDSNKRKMTTFEEQPAKKQRILNADENGNITGSFGLTEDMLEYSSEEEDNEHVSNPTETTALELEHFQPSFTKGARELKSAMKTGQKSPKKVGFATKNEVKTYPNLGPAGEYRGTLFRMPGDPIYDGDNSFVMSPSASLRSSASSTPPNVSFGKTLGNTTENQGHRDTDFTRPFHKRETPETSAYGKSHSHSVVITNKDGHFSVPDDDDTENSIHDDAEDTPIPSAPKISHAALPRSDDRLNKARQEAQQYKPKQASRLSQVEPARSRSSSPPPVRGLGTTPGTAEKVREAEKWAAGLDWPEPPTYDDPVKAREEEQKMREAEEWASNLDWPEPVSYVDAGLCSQYIDDLIRKRWTAEDDRITHEFWAREFDDVNNMMNAAKAEGKILELVV